MTEQPTFVRDRFTWLAYLSLAYYAYLQASLGPLMPFLRQELGLNYTTSGLHFSAFALGMILSGLTADRVALRWGRPLTFWVGGGGMAASALLLTVGRPVYLTVASTFLMGWLGSLLLIMIQSTLSDRHGARRAIPLTESNIAASVLASFAPLLVGLSESIGLGWRGGVWAAAAYWLGLLLWLRRASIPPAAVEDDAADNERPIRQLPPVFWGYWLVIFLSVGVEWSVIYWAADFLISHVQLPSTTAATIVTVYFVATVLGRVAGSRLTRHFSVQRLLLAAAGLALAGFMMFWQLPGQVLSISGLFVVGLGVANLFPLGLSVASSVVTPRQSDRASGRISFAAGAAILIAPQLLGTIADVTSIQTAYGLVFVILLAIIGVIIGVRRLSTD